MSQGTEPWSPRHGDGPVPPPGRDEAPSSASTPSRHGSGVIRPVPQSDGPSFEAIAMQSVLSRARDSSRFDAPEVERGNGPRARVVPLRLLLVVAAVLVGLGVAGGVLWVAFFRDVPLDGTTIVNASETADAKLRTPQETVRGYLAALEKGDIEAALEFGPLSGAGSQALLNPVAHAAMPKESRPSNIFIDTVDPLATEVDVRYTLAGEPVSTAIRVVRMQNGSYQLARATVTIQLEMVGGDNLTVFVNGNPVQHKDPLEVVPGTYELSTKLPFIAFQDSRPVTILSLAHTDTSPFPVSPELTDQGRSALLEAAKASLARCVSSAELAPEGCPNEIGARKPVAPGSVKWTLINKATVWQQFQPALSPSDQTVAVATVPLQLDVRMDYADGHSSGKNPQKLNAVVSATMLGSDPTAVTVSWER